MPVINPDDGYLTVLNLFSTDAPQKQEQLLAAMREIVDTAAFPGWISSTVHAGVEWPGTANFIQWRSRADLDSRYDQDVFKHRTVPLFEEMSTAMRLCPTQVAFSLRHPSQGDVTEISPNRDDYTVIEVMRVAEDDRTALIAALADAYTWMVDVPGFRSLTALSGDRAHHGIEGSFVLAYSQWSDREAYAAFRTAAPADQSDQRRRSQKELAELVTARDWNGYRVVHTRSALVVA